MSNFISLETISKIKYARKYTVQMPLRESALIIKNRCNSKKVNDIINVIENWNAISCNADQALYTIIRCLDNFNESDQNEIIYKLDKEMLPIVSEVCIMQLCEDASSADNMNEKLLGLLDNYRLFHRIDSNYNKLNDRIGISKMISESKFYKQTDERKRDIIDNIIKTIYEAYNIKDSYKFNITLESLLYSFKQAGMNLDEKLAMKYVTEYYVNNTSIDKDELKTIIAEINLYSESTKEYVLEMFNENKKTRVDGVVKNTRTIKDMCDVFNTAQEKSVDNLKSLLTRIYARSIDDIVEDSPSVLGALTSTLTTLGAAAINPVIGMLVAFTQYHISRSVNIDQATKYLESLKAERRKVEKKINNTKGNTSDLEKYLDKLNVSIEKIDNYKYSIQSEKENDKDLENDDLTFESTSTILAYLSCFNEAIEHEDIDSMNALSEALETNGKLDLTIFTEAGNLANTVKLVKEKLKNSMSKLSTKEKAICKEMDTRFDIFVRDFERSMSLEKRENVIKGQVMPSITKMIKMAIAGTVGAIYAPTLTAIALIGGYAISKKATIKEKQYILDEIDVQLKIIERKINQAEMKGDDKALENLYRLQARLDKEYKRIKYRMRLYHESGYAL